MSKMLTINWEIRHTYHMMASGGKRNKPLRGIELIPYRILISKEDQFSCSTKFVLLIVDQHSEKKKASKIFEFTHHQILKTDIFVNKALFIEVHSILSTIAHALSNRIQ